MNVFFSALLGGLSAVSLAAAAQAECVVDFENDVQRVLNRRCVACHNDQAPGADLSLQSGSTIENIVGVPSVALERMNRVEPGNVEESYLAHKLLGTHADVGGSGEKMPQGGRLRDSELEPILAWIESCAGEAETAAE